MYLPLFPSNPPPCIPYSIFFLASLCPLFTSVIAISIPLRSNKVAHNNIGVCPSTGACNSRVLCIYIKIGGYHVYTKQVQEKTFRYVPFYILEDMSVIFFKTKKKKKV